MRFASALQLVLFFPLAVFAASQQDRCERTSAAALLRCVDRTVACEALCAKGGACRPCEEVTAAAAQRLSRHINAACNAASLQGVGFGAPASPDGVATRLADVCATEAAALYARSFGGPQAAVLATASAAGRACLTTAHREAAAYIHNTTKRMSLCIRKDHRRGPGTCDPAMVAFEIATARARAQAFISAACPDLKALVGLDVAGALDRAAQQSRCLVAAVHGDTGPLTLDCGQGAPVSVPARGEWVQVVLNEAVWGTRCGNGSPYAFWLRLAPEGSPLERLMVHLQGGGVCIFEGDCAAIPASLFEAQNDYQPNGPTGGIFSTDPAVNPFSDWTMVALPYCTQDIHIGGGNTTVFPGITVHRWGGLNTRATLRYVRDVLWKAMNQIDAQGYHPDRLRTLFVGESAGGFGVMYNYHYLLDDLGWRHTTAVPDSSLALDNGGVGIGALGTVLSGDTGPSGWRLKPMLPPYCQAGNCGVGPVLMNATAPRLRAVPEQIWLNLSNQNDSTQVATTFFLNTPSWITELRQSYCETKGLNGVHYFMPAETSSIHTMLSTQSRYTTLAAEGVTVRDFLAGAVGAPAGVVDRVDEGAIAATFGVPPIACLP